MSKACVACGHSIDTAARLCPYCGADPATGEKVDTEAILREVFQTRRVSASESVLEFARHRQGVVVATGVVIVFFILAALHQFVTMRNNTAVTSGPAVPLTEITDLSDQQPDTQQLPMPELNFQYDGRGQTMRTFIVEPGAVTPPEIAQQQAAAQQPAAQQGAAALPGQPAQQPAPGGPAPGAPANTVGTRPNTAPPAAVPRPAPATGQPQANPPARPQH